VTTADVLCEVQRHVKSPPGNERRSGRRRTPAKVERPTDDLAVDDCAAKKILPDDDRPDTDPSRDSGAVSSCSREAAAASLFHENSKDDRSYAEDLFTRRKLSSDEEEWEEEQLMADVIQVRNDSVPTLSGVDDVEATAAKHLADDTNRFAISNDHTANYDLSRSTCVFLSVYFSITS